MPNGITQLWQEGKRPWWIPTGAQLLEGLTAPIATWGKGAAATLLSPFYEHRPFRDPLEAFVSPTEIAPQAGRWPVTEMGGIQRAYEEWQAPWGVKGATELAAEMPFYMMMPNIPTGGIFTKLAQRAGVGRLVPKIERGIQKQGEKIIARARIGQTIPEEELIALGRKSPEAEEVLRQVLRQIKPRAEFLQNQLPHQIPGVKLSALKMRQQTDKVANELAEHLGVTPIERRVITESTLERGFWQRKGDKLKGFTTRTYRTERLLLRMDKYVEGGKMNQAFWQPVEQATNRKIAGNYNALEELNVFLAKNNVNLGKVLSQRVEIEGIALTPSERIGVYLHSLNPDNLVHIVFGNSIPAKTVTKIVESLTPEEKLIASYLQQFFKKQTPLVGEVVKRVTGKAMETVENYFPIRISRRAMATGELDFNQILIDERKARYAAKWASSKIRKGFTLPRTGKAMQPVELDALGTWLTHLEGIEHYKAFAPVIKDLQRLLINPNLKRSIIKKDGLPTFQVLEQWLKDVAQTNPLRVASTGEAILRRLRVNSVSAVLGLNITTSLKQFPSFISGMAEIGELPALRGLFTSLAHPRETELLIKQLAPQIFKRRFEREIAEAAILKSTRGRLTGRISPKEMFMILTTTMDRVAVRGLWRGAFDDGIKRGMSSEVASEVATRTIRRTQPYFGVKDIPEFWRAGEGLKWLTIFTNQLNQYWNYYRFDITGKAAAGEISKAEVVRRAIETFVVPALMIGAISRSRPAQNIEEFGRDSASMALATVPIVGSFLASGLKGFYGNQGVVALEGFERAQQIIYQGTRANWLKTMQLIPELAGYMIGIPVAQPRRTIMGLLDLASNKTDDWMRLIYGEYTRREAGREATEQPKLQMPQSPTERWEQLKKKLQK